MKIITKISLPLYFYVWFVCYDFSRYKSIKYSHLFKSANPWCESLRVLVRVRARQAGLSCVFAWGKECPLVCELMSTQGNIIHVYSKHHFHWATLVITSWSVSVLKRAPRSVYRAALRSWSLFTAPAPSLEVLSTWQTALLISVIDVPKASYEDGLLCIKTLPNSIRDPPCSSLNLHCRGRAACQFSWRLLSLITGNPRALALYDVIKVYKVETWVTNVSFCDLRVKWKPRVHASHSTAKQCGTFIYKCAINGWWTPVAGCVLEQSVGSLITLGC